MRGLDTPEELLDSRIEVYNKSDRLEGEARERWQAVAERALATKATGEEPSRRRRKRRRRTTRDSEDAVEGASTSSSAAATEKLQPAVLLASARTGEGIAELNSLLAERLSLRMGRSRRTLEVPLGGALAGEQLSYLHKHPRVTVVETSVDESGETMLVTVEADESALNAFDGQRWAARG